MVEPVPLAGGWSLLGVMPGACGSPDQLDSLRADWQPTTVPGTVAATLHEDINDVGDYDAKDWWYRSTFDGPAGEGAVRCYLRFGGLATLCKVWLNGTLILSSRNMFREHRIDISQLIQRRNQLVLLFESLSTATAQRHARPRWKTALVAQQNLRWFRTTLLGRIPGWTPQITPVGPWRPITLELGERVELTQLDLQSIAAGTAGKLRIDASVLVADGCRVDRARLLVADRSFDLNVAIAAAGAAESAGSLQIRAELALEDIALWWPHTHGEPHLHDCRLDILADGAWQRVYSGRVGFKQLRVDHGGGGPRFIVNGTEVFCRGACWTTADILTLVGGRDALRRILGMARDAGLNMLRIGGTMVYESPEFYGLCDELGILVWQDFMFANMDYPVDDAAFRAEVDGEVQQQLNRLQRHVCIAAYCGGSEVAQQAAMLGVPAADWTNSFFAQTLPQQCARWHDEVPYFPSTPCGGALPFHLGTGISHYYGVGAYRRPLSEVRHAGVRFTTECLGFSNVPDHETMAILPGGVTPPPHHPRWKARVPRDSGTGWDFEDIRDHYFKVLFGTDPIDLRSIDVERYYRLSRVVTGEVMQRVFAEWRMPDNPCHGGLVWFFQDLWPGAGWGVIDSLGRPKAAYWYLRRAWANRSVFFSDEGLDGLKIGVVNESAQALDATLQLNLYQHGRLATGSASASVHVPARGTLTLQADAMLGYFADLTWAYRFGPSKHDVVAASLIGTDGAPAIAEAFYFPCGLGLPMQHNVQVETTTHWGADGVVRVKLRSAVFLQSVSVSCREFLPSDNYFHLRPGEDKHLVFTPAGHGAQRFKAEFEALNAMDCIVVRTSP